MIIAATELKKLLKSVAAKDDILLDSKSGVLTSVSPDLTVSVRTGNFVSRTPFLVATDGKKLGQVVARMSGDIAIHLDGAALVLKSAKAVIRLETKPAKPFSPPPAKDTIVLPLSAIKPLLQYVSIAADKNKAGEYAGGIVKLKSKGSRIEVAATDGARLALASVEYKGADKFDYVLPLPAVAALKNLEGDAVEVSETDSYLYFAAGNVSLFAAKLAKEFVDYQSYLPKKFKAVYQVDAEAFKNCLLTIKPLAAEVGEPAIFVHFLDGQVSVTTRDGAATDSTDCTQFSPDEVFEGAIESKIPVSLDSILSFFANVTGDVLLSANSGKEPIWLESGTKQMLVAVLAN